VLDTTSFYLPSVSHSMLYNLELLTSLNKL
jgi:hypothetical protein